MKFLLALVFVFFVTDSFSQSTEKYKIYSFDYLIESKSTGGECINECRSYKYVNATDNSFRLLLSSQSTSNKDSTRLTFLDLKKVNADTKVSYNDFNRNDTINFNCSYSKLNRTDEYAIQENIKWKYIKVKDTFVNNVKLSMYKQSNRLNKTDYYLLKKDPRFVETPLIGRDFKVNNIAEKGIFVFTYFDFLDQEFKNKRSKKRYVKKFGHIKSAQRTLVSITKIKKYVAIKIDCNK